jgi:hypothetical protein
VTPVSLKPSRGRVSLCCANQARAPASELSWMSAVADVISSFLLGLMFSPTRIAPDGVRDTPASP